MNQLIYFLVFLVLVPLLFSFWVEGLSFLSLVVTSPILTWFAAGLLTSAVMGAVLGGAVVDFLETAVHELTHAAVGFLFLGPVEYMEAKSKGGGLTRIGNAGGCNPFLLFFFLAPYCLPLLTIPFLIAKPIVASMGNLVNNVVDYLIGLTLGFHYVIHIKQFSFTQDDLKQVGGLVSVGMTYTFMLVFLVIIVAVVLGEYNRILDFFTNAFTNSFEYYRTVLAWLQNLWQQLRPQLRV